MGIFIQDDKKTASVNDGNLIKRHIHPNNQDPMSSARNAMFQYMIGNTDYSITYQHNEKLFYIDDKIVPIPYDFDMSGMVNASYAVVSAINNKPLPITKVTDRLYRGFDRDDEILQNVRNEFINHEQDIYLLMDRYQSYFRYPREFTECKSYIQSFYKIIKDDKKFENRILKNYYRDIRILKKRLTFNGVENYITELEILLFDNSVTLHRRKDPGHKDRCAYRLQYDPSNLLDSPWYPFNHLPEYAEKYKVQTHELIQTLNIQDFKLP